MSNSRSNSQMIRSPRARVRGVSLIELMVAMVISFVLIGGAIQVYLFSRQNYDVNESVSRLQETARYALSIIEPDIRMANSWGLIKGAGFVDVTGVTATATNCGDNFALNVMDTLGGTNNGYTWECVAAGNGAMPTADTLIIRRASVLPATAAAGVKVCSTRTVARLLTNTSTCPADPIGQLNDLVVNAYYVDRDSNSRAELPTLRRYALDGVTSLTDSEIVPGVEDMQVQFGIDPSGTRGIATRYVNPGAVPAGSQIVSVRIWLLVRSETPEQDFTNAQKFEYGERSEGSGGLTTSLTDTGATTAAYKPNDKFRRLLVSRTIQVRNAMGI
jgi:type IV pilus assembly protein PilW